MALENIMNKEFKDKGVECPFSEENITMISYVAIKIFMDYQCNRRSGEDMVIGDENIPISEYASRFLMEQSYIKEGEEWLFPTPAYELALRLLRLFINHLQG